jgi:hypothetical protein
MRFRFLTPKAQLADNGITALLDLCDGELRNPVNNPARNAWRGAA